MSRPSASAVGREDRERSRSPRAASNQDLSEEESWEDSAQSRTEEEEVPALGADQRRPWGDGQWWLGLSPHFPRYLVDPLVRSSINFEDSSSLSFAVVVERWGLLHYLFRIEVTNGRQRTGAVINLMLAQPPQPQRQQMS